MICQVCKQDHTDKNMRWCDRSDLQIENDYLRAENARYIERIEELTSELSKLKVQADRHREVLEFYAENPKRENGTQFSNSVEEFGNLMGDDIFCVTWEPILDLGRRAREALKGGE